MYLIGTIEAYIRLLRTQPKSQTPSNQTLIKAPENLRRSLSRWMILYLYSEMMVSYFGLATSN
jgi:hypothetical protein